MLYGAVSYDREFLPVAVIDDETNTVIETRVIKLDGNYYCPFCGKIERVLLSCHGVYNSIEELISETVARCPYCNSNAIVEKDGKCVTKIVSRILLVYAVGVKKLKPNKIHESVGVIR